MAIIDAVNRWLSALNDHDIEAIADAIAPGGTYLEPTLESPIDNEATGQHLARFFGVYPDAHWEALMVGAMSDTTAALHWRMTGTYQSNGKPVASNGADFYTYDPVSDRLSSVVGYFDVLSALKQTRD
jgi:SnoaL-like domain